MRIGIDARKIADYGIGTYIRGLLEGLAEIGGEEEYVIFAPTGAPVPGGFEHVPLDTPHYSVRELVVIGRAVARAGVDLFHAPHYVVPLTRCPTVVTIHDLIHLRTRHRNPVKPLYARTMLARAVRKSVRILTVTEAVKQDIVTTFRCSPEHVVVTPNGVGSRFTPEGARRHGRYVLFVGNDKPHKNVDLLVEVFDLARRSERDLRLLLAGGKFDRFHRREGVEVLGFVSDDELAALYRGAIALLMPSSDEGFGLPALEAMACGTPVITSRAAALMEVTGEAAMHVDAEELSATIVRVATDEELRLAMSQRGIARASQFTWRRCAERTRAIYLVTR